MIRVLAALILVASACSQRRDDERKPLFVSASGFVVTRGGYPGDPGCGPLSGQWEKARYAVSDGDVLTVAAFDTVASAVERCLADVGEPATAARCLWPREAWQLERDCTTVLAVPGVESCTRPGTWLLPDEARGECDDKPTTRPDGGDCSDAACRWAVATQDSGRTVVVPAQDPSARLAEALVHISTGCLYPWLDPGLARCAGVP